MNLKDFHGVVAKCHCTNPELSMSCKSCFSRGFVAVCLQCSGTGQVKVPVAGAASGDMKSTCDKCGGMGHFGVPKPANWDAEHAPKEEVQADTKEVDEEEDFKAVTAGANDIPTEEQIEAAQASGEHVVVERPDPMMEAYQEIKSEPALPELKRPVSIHWTKWKKMTSGQQVTAIEEANKIELVTA